MADKTTVATKDDFHLERSHFLDAFAALEEALLANPAAAKAEPLADQLKDLRSVRNDLVHAQLRFVQMDGELQAIVINAQNLSRPARPARILFLKDFKALKTKISQARSASTKATCV